MISLQRTQRGSTISLIVRSFASWPQPASFPKDSSALRAPSFLLFFGFFLVDKTKSTQMILSSKFARYMYEITIMSH